MMKYLLLLLFLAVPVSADLFEEMLNQTYVQSASEMPAFTGTANVQEQHYKHIIAWVDITGFKGEIIENGVHYIHGNPADSAIVQYDAYFNMPKGQQCYTCTLDSIKKTITVSQSGNYTVATLTVVLKFHETLCAQNSCWLEYYEETGTFQDRALSPQQYPPLEPPQVDIIEYNNTIQEKISVSVTAKNVSIIEVNYGNKTAKHFLKYFAVENNTGEAVKTDTWELSGLGRIQNTIIMDTDLSTLDYSELNVTIYSPYQSLKADYHTFNITRLESSPETVLFNPVLIFFVGSIAIFGYSSYSLLRRFTL